MVKTLIEKKQTITQIERPRLSHLGNLRSSWRPCVKVITLLLSPQNVIDAVQSEGNLNQIESLRRIMTTIGSGHGQRDTHK